MLTKNVYILYPAGYSGNYLSWAISVSDTDLSLETVKNPINTDPSDKKYGGSGTSHLHHRIPTHQGIRQHISWMLFNKPTHPKIYVLSSVAPSDVDPISIILSYDSDPVIINIHDNNDQDIQRYGNINCVIKWPAYLEAYEAWKPKKFNPYNCSDDINFRNMIANQEIYLGTNSAISQTRINIITEYLRNLRSWFQVRHNVSPHEVNTDYYIVRNDIPQNTIFECSCSDISSENFPAILHSILTQSQCSDDFDTTYLHDFHPQYISAQTHLQWFKSIALWRISGILDEYLLHHSVTQGFVIREMFQQYRLSLGTDMQKLDEMANWKTVSITDINQIYQRVKQLF